MSIHHSSHDPVFVKKISLRLWKLRDEIEAVIEHKNENGDVKALKEEYANSVLTTHISEESEESAETAEGEEGSDQEAAEEQAETQTAEQAEDNAASVEVKQRRPQISEDKLIRGVAVLAEIRMDNLFLFCNKTLMPGQSVVVDFMVPKRFVINAEVVFCRPYNMKSRIISNNKLPYRAAVKFTFLKEGERTLLRQFLESIEPDTEFANHIAEAAASAAKDDDLGDLDDLDL